MAAERRASFSDATAPRPHVLREYALLADGERGVLVGPRGEHVWMCFPRWHSAAIFSSLIGGGGVYSVTPRERHVWGGYYEPRSLIWRSRWVTSQATIECREALLLPSEPDRAVILRRVLALSGTARVEVLLNARGDFGRAPMAGAKLREDGVWTGSLGDDRVCWHGAAEARAGRDGHRGTVLTLSLELEEGGHHDLVLELASAGGEHHEIGPPEQAWAAVEAEWHRRIPWLQDMIAPRDATHAYAVLSGLTSSGGGMVAAATTSLPEHAREGRSYDYRYAWMRDQAYTGTAAAAAGALPLMDGAVRFVSERLLADGGELKPAYTVTGGPVPDEHELQLPGYPGGTDIAGNWVNGQFQLDAFGEALTLFAAAAARDHLEAEGWRAAEVAAGVIERRWNEQGVDAGIWELEPDEWTHSRLVCAAGLRNIAAHAGRRQAARWASLADQIVSHTAEHALHPSGRWQRTPRDPRPDAALLLAALRGAVSPDDPRSLATLRAVEQELTEDLYCYRYRPDERPLGQAEGAFLLCGFLMSLSYAQIGEHLDAVRWFERNRAACGPPGLLSEEFDVAQRQLRGNLPQAFVHALLLECASRNSGLIGGDAS